MIIGQGKVCGEQEAGGCVCANRQPQAGNSNKRMVKGMIVNRKKIMAVDSKVVKKMLTGMVVMGMAAGFGGCAHKGQNEKTSGKRAEIMERVKVPLREEFVEGNEEFAMQVQKAQATTQPDKVHAVAEENFKGWIKKLGDAQIEQLVAQAMEKNGDLAAAEAGYAVAKGQLMKAWSGFWPRLDANAGASRTDVGPGGPANRYEISGAVSWEVDVWGRIRMGIEAAQADVQSAQADALGARNLLAAQVAQAWVVAVAAREQQTIDLQNLAAEERNAQITKNKAEAGVNTQLDWSLAEANVATAREAVARSKTAMEDGVRALEILVGRYPAKELEVATNLETIGGTAGEEVVTGVPARLLERRPDVVAAERKVAAATGRWNAAKVAQLPSVTLTASLGTLLDPQNTIWSIGANLLAPLFDGLEREADVRINRALRDQAWGQYVQTAIRAFGEVETALGNEKSLKERRVQLEQAVVSLEKAVQVARARYEEGELTLLELIQTQRQYFTTRSLLLQVRAEQWRQRIGLYLALGGDSEMPAQEQEPCKSCEQETTDVATTQAAEQTITGEKHEPTKEQAPAK